MLKNKKSLKVFLLCVFVLAVSLGSNCPPPAGDPASVKKMPELRGVVDYGNGVFYFPYHSADFGNALSGFKAAHKDLEFVGGMPNDSGTDGTMGYFVVFKEK